MILPWMLYTGAVTLLLGLSARCLEGVVRQRNLPVRGLWMGALLGSVLLPILSLVVPVRGTSSPVNAASFPQSVPISDAGTLQGLALVPQLNVGTPAGVDLDSLLLGAWGLGSALLAVGLALSYGAVLRRSREWVRRDLDGRDIWISRDTGPAVVGFRRSRIVLPEWIAEHSAQDQKIIIAHEQEHLQARDPHLLLSALLLLVALPWNVALWWQCRRLRQAIEVDCDLRVLARGVDPRGYSRLLVGVSERGIAHRFVMAALSESTSFLERRIRLMFTPQPKRWRGRATVSALSAGLLVFAACQVDRPDQSPIPTTGVTLAASESGELTPVKTPATREEAMRLAIEHSYPQLLTDGVPGGTAVLTFITNTRGEIERSALLDGPPANGQISASPNFLSQVFPDTDWKAAWRSGYFGEGGGAGGRTFRPGEIGPNTVIVVWFERGVEGEPTAPFLFSAGPSPFIPEPVLRAAIQRHHPGVLADGIEPGEMLWFIVTDGGEVLETGRGLRVDDSRDAHKSLEAQFPGIKIDGVQMSSAVQSVDGKPLPLVWAKLEKSSPRP
jgi:beta-lactamase regulating signal transducer with metallopeptidase domain